MGGAVSDIEEVIEGEMSRLNMQGRDRTVDTLEGQKQLMEILREIKIVRE